MSALDRRLDLLRDAGIETARHTGRGLLEHLIGTRDVLASWGARPALCDAGLFHSVYGTEFFRSATLGPTDRAAVRDEIGDEAEEIAWLWCVIRRATLADNIGREAGCRVQSRVDDSWIPITTTQFHDLVNLMIADSVEQLPQLVGSHAQEQRELLLYRDVALPQAIAALEAALPAPA